ncbi:hypothetical protein SZN_04776 [Streptomyces zinciresistens K42]|uniref:Uncharacterized protein n=1 Tax=Streptomyces zinciresistens K42 TaxID=700597 RepID=G2G649_9ACTN|nr:hypothetical protein SZN_04776 [Streptomyces zinciresistens K42]
MDFGRNWRKSSKTLTEPGNYTREACGDSEGYTQL